MKVKELVLILSKANNPDAEMAYVSRLGDPPRRIVDLMQNVDGSVIYLVAEIGKSGRKHK